MAFAIWVIFPLYYRYCLHRICFLLRYACLPTYACQPTIWTVEKVPNSDDYIAATVFHDPTLVPISCDIRMFYYTGERKIMKSFFLFQHLRFRKSLSTRSTGRWSETNPWLSTAAPLRTPRSSGSRMDFRWRPLHKILNPIGSSSQTDPCFSSARCRTRRSRTPASTGASLPMKMEWQEAPTRRWTLHVSLDLHWVLT